MNRDIIVAMVGAVALIGAAITAGIFTIMDDNQAPVFSNLTVDKLSPQFVDSIIKVSASADDPDKDIIRYKFWLKRATKKGGMESVQNWSTQSWWEWRPDKPGDYHMEVHIRDGNHADEGGHDDARVIRYQILSLIGPATAETPEGRTQQWIDRGIALEDSGKWKKALEAFDQAIQIDPNNEKALIKKGKALHYLRRYEEIIPVLNKVLQINPQSSTALNNKAQVEYSLGRYDEALRTINLVIELVPDDPDFLGNKCGFLRIDAVGRYKEAIEVCDKALKLDPTIARIWNHKGGALHSLERYEEAIEAYNKAVEIDTSFALAWYNRGASFFMWGRYAKAIESLDRAIQIDPGDVAAHNVKRLAEGRLHTVKGVQ